MKPKLSLTAGFVIMSMSITACLSVFVPVGTPTPIPTEQTLPTILPTVETLVTVSPAPSQSQYAAMCAVDPLISYCKSPVVEQRDKFCVKKYPYVLLATNPGVTFEPVTSGLKCTDEGIRGGDQIISCTGPDLLPYDLKVCNAACNTTALDTTSGKCQSGYGYSAEAQCCWPVPTDDSGCVIFKVEIGTCN
jgi:hypothetical protein